MRRSLLLLVVLIVATTACGEIRRTVSGSSELDGEWVLTSGSDADGGLELSSRDEVTLELDGDSMSGYAPCNSHSGNVDVDDSKIEVEPMGITAMACQDRGLMEAESRYLAALGAVDSYDLEAGVLTLTGPETELVYEDLPPVPTASFTGTEWRLESLIDGLGSEGTASSTLAGSLTFADDGTFQGTTGCRDISGRWEDTGDRIATSEIELGTGRCRGLKVEQDEHLVSVLEAGFTVDIVENVMTLEADSIDLGLAYRTES